MKPNKKLSSIIKGNFPVDLLGLSIRPVVILSEENYSLPQITRMGENIIDAIINIFGASQERILSFVKVEGCGMSLYIEYLYMDNSESAGEKEKFFSFEVIETMDEAYFKLFRALKSDKGLIYGSSQSALHHLFFAISDIISFRASLRMDNDTRKEPRFNDLSLDYFRKLYLTEAEESFVFEELEGV